MRREEATTAIDLMQVLHRRPGDGKSVEGRCTPADLVQNDQRAVRRLIEDGGGFHHLHHEGRAATRQIVRRADTRKQPVHNADMGSFRRHEGTDLRKDGDQRILAQEGRFTAHVGTGEQPDRAVLAAIDRR